MKKTPPPPIDGRRRSELLAEAIERARSYTPEWEPDEGDVGTALLNLFADVTTDVTVRLDRTPEKHRVAFFDALGFDRAPPQPARLPLVFQVAEGLDSNVRLSAGTQAVAPPEGDGAEQVFEIPEGEAFEATPARLDAVYSVSPDHDAIFEHWTGLTSGDGTQLFSGRNVQEHVLYLGHTDFFTLTPTTEFEVRIEGPDVDAFETLRWEYYGAALIDGESVEGWHPLPRRLRPAREDDAVTLRFKLEKESEFVETTLPVDEETDEETPEGAEPKVTELPSRWIRCRSPASLDDDLYATRVSSVSFSLVGYGAGLESKESTEGDAMSEDRASENGNETSDDIEGVPGLEPDVLLANDVPLPTEGLPKKEKEKEEENGNKEEYKPQYPFGEMPLPLDAFYIASDEAFSKKGMTVKLVFQEAVTNTAPPPAEYIPTEEDHQQLDLSWEYWNGSGWAYLGLETDDLWNENDGGVVTFVVPSDIEATAVSGQESHWIRARVREDGYLQFRTGRVLDTAGNVKKVLEDDTPEIWEIIHEAVPSFGKLVIDYPGGSEATTGDGDDNGNGDGNGNGDDNGNGENGITQPVIYPQHAVTRNNLTYGVDEARSLTPYEPETELEPFRRLPDDIVQTPAVPAQTLYLGFDGPLDDGPIQLLFSAVDKTYDVRFYPRARWEYRVNTETDGPATDEWARLSAEDGTEGLARRGLVGLTFPETTTESERFGRERHWIRARLIGDEFDVVVTESGARDVPDSDVPIRLLTDAASDGVAIENTTDQAFGLAGYRLSVEPANAARETLTFSGDLPGESVLLPGGTLVVRGHENATDVSLTRFDERPIDGSGDVSLETPDETPLVETGGVVDDETGTENAVGAGVSLETSPGPVHPCETMGPVVLSTDALPTRSPPTLRGLYPNAGWADNVQTIAEEFLGSSDGSADQTFSFGNQPAIDETVWVDELSALPEEERETLAEADPEAVDERTAEDGDVTAFWVRWTPVENFVESTTDARHYVVDRTGGTLTFGDGTHGAIPPIGENNVRTSYRTGGGVDGNVGSGTVAALVTAVVYVESVTNPDPGEGGAAAESTAETVRRAARTLKDRNRAVTAADFERLAMSASRELARVRCLPGVDREGVTRPGWVTVLLIPQTREPKPMPSPEIRRRVEETLRQYAPAPLTETKPEQFVVRGPGYVEVSVRTDLVVEEGVPSVAAIEEDATDRVAAFLHPLTGGPDGEGWGFGDLPCLSDFYALLERVVGVDHVGHLEVTFHGRNRDHTITDGDDQLPDVTPDTLVFGTTHDVQAGGEPADTTDTIERAQ